MKWMMLTGVLMFSTAQTMASECSLSERKNYQRAVTSYYMNETSSTAADTARLAFIQKLFDCKETKPWNYCHAAYMTAHRLVSETKAEAAVGQKTEEDVQLAQDRLDEIARFCHHP